MNVSMTAVRHTSPKSMSCKWGVLHYMQERGASHTVGDVCHTHADFLECFNHREAYFLQKTSLANRRCTSHLLRNITSKGRCNSTEIV